MWCQINTLAIALKALTTKRDAAQEQVNGLNLAIKALGGSVGTAKATTTKTPGQPRATRNRSANGAPVSPELQAKLDAIRADTTLTPIQKAQQSRKARFEASKASPEPNKPLQGAVLSEAVGAD